MSARPHDFVANTIREEVVRAILDVFYAERGVVMSIHHVKVEFQLLAGIDRVMTLRNGIRNTYEDKADFRAGDTGNLFIETWSKPGKVRGWAYTCGAQYIDWFIAPNRTLIFGEMLRLKERVREWEQSKRFPEREAVNANYVTLGLIVPIATVVNELEFSALEVPEVIVRTGIARFCARAASRDVGAIVTEAVARAVGEVWEYCLEVVGPDPKGRIAGIPYRGADDVAAILEHATQKHIVAAKLQRDGAASEEWFAQKVGGARLAPVVAQLRTEGWNITIDPETRTYHLVRVAAPGASAVLPLFGESA